MQIKQIRWRSRRTYWLSVLFLFSRVGGFPLVAEAIEVPVFLEGREVVSGRTERVTVAQAKKATVVVFLSAKCPCSASHEEVLKQLHADFVGKGFAFVGVHANQDEAAELTAAHFKQARLPFPMLQDTENKLADAFGALKTPHVFVLAPSGAVLYQGGVDDSNVQAMAKRHYLQAALTSIAQGRVPELQETRTLGCVIGRR